MSANAPAKSKAARRSGGASASDFMDAATSAYVRRHELARTLDSIGSLLHSVDEGLGVPSTRHNGAACSLTASPSTLKARSPLTKQASSPSATRASEKAALETTLALQLLLSSFSGSASPPPCQNAGSSGMPKPTMAKLISFPSSAESNADPSTGESSTGLAAASSGLSSPLLLWPEEASFASKEAAVKAELCRSFAVQCARLHDGHGLVDAYGANLRWSHVVPAAGGSERLGVALVFEVFRCWRSVVVPLLHNTGELTLPLSSAKDDGVDSLFACLLQHQPPSVAAKRTNAGEEMPVASSRVDQVCSYWCYTMVQGFCRDFSATLWESILRAARGAAAAQDVYRSTAPASVTSLVPPLSCETLLLRSFMAHLACPVSESAGGVLPSSATNSTESAMASCAAAVVDAAKERSHAWAWSEVMELHAAVSQCTKHGQTRCLLSALLCADGYWAEFMQPYSAMFAQYFL